MTERSDIERFIMSMPARYAAMFDPDTMEKHARTVRARNQRLVNIGLFECAGRKHTGLSVVAPDRPGLLAIISLAFANCELDIIEAEVFTRHAAGMEDEALDLFWVRRHPPHRDTPLAAVDIRHIRDTLVGLLKRAPRELLPQQTSSSKTPSATGTLVRFLEDSEGRFATLEIETNDRSGLLLGVCQALFNEDVQILGSHIKAEGGRVKGRFEVAELTERPIDWSRRHLIKLAVMHALDNLDRDAISSMVG
jgi:UTP:GlnB (protein PII) uridylyltransferase